ncbi:class I glutamine amidotransferase-like protein, partial [Sporormia fimetaria CBS 119925]
PKMSPTPPETPTRIGILLFPGFQLLDVTGPLDILSTHAATTPLHLSLLSSSLTPVSTSHHVHAEAGSAFGASLVPTRTFDSAPDDLEVLIVPGGIGCRKPENVHAVIEFIRKYYAAHNAAQGKGELKWVLSVCTGSDILAQAGVLEGRRATTNKRRFGWVKERNPGVNWVAKARWVADGDVWTSSGISAGMDLTLAWIAEVWGEETAEFLADATEYERNREPGNDRFAERWGAV